MRMIERSPRGLAMVLEDHDVLKTTVLFEIENPVTKCPEQVFHPFYRHGGQSFHMVGGLNDHLMSADAVHLDEHSIGLAVQVTFNAQSRKFVRHHTQVPVCVALASIFSRPIRQNFRRRLSFIARTKLADLMSARSREKSLGRLERSVEMITQRPVMGSFRSSGTRISYNPRSGCENATCAAGRICCLLFCSRQSSVN